MTALLHVLRRWPTALAVGMAAATFGGTDLQAKTAGYGEALLILPLLYLTAARLHNPRAAWPILAVSLAAVVGLGFAEVPAPAAVFAALALAVLVWGAVRGELNRRDEFGLQALGMVAFGALALTGLVIDAEAGRYVVAAGWLLHGVWDFVHLYRDRVVVRSYAEWCGVIDILVAVELVFLL
ncbi:hypothetical protein G5C51_18830 [Streptomyces sp. A7024]|uniref:Uncharacterized protein n=1 Tax=Streptomyces coryli TaxID=1128680 RepID=A0A6G4U1R7_9ACTN|nr:hypothetical protein [Streptomyces coryli]NGN65942.1 hypothetical protein [Streptomyces coryli]